MRKAATLARPAALPPGADGADVPRCLENDGAAADNLAQLDMQAKP